MKPSRRKVREIYDNGDSLNYGCYGPHQLFDVIT